MPGGPKHAAHAGSVGTSAWWDAHSWQQELSTGPSGHTPAARLLAWPKFGTAAGLAAQHREQGCAGPLGKAGF